MEPIGSGPGGSAPAACAAGAVVPEDPVAGLLAEDVELSTLDAGAVFTGARVSSAEGASGSLVT